MPGCVHHVKKMTGGVFEPVEPPIEKPEDPTTPPSTKDLRTIKIEENIMAVVGTNNWNAIAYGNGKYVAVVQVDMITTSTDGKTWTTPTKIAEFSYTWNDIIYANGKFVVCGSYSYIAVSTNGTNWTTYKVGFPLLSIIGMVLHMATENLSSLVGLADIIILQWYKLDNAGVSLFIWKLVVNCIW